VIPLFGPGCDMCTPDVHYLLRCECGREWDEPPCPGVFECPQCGVAVEVTPEEDEAWERDVLGLLPNPGPQAQAHRKQ
jgi:hypothetical protein